MSSAPVVPSTPVTPANATATSTVLPKTTAVSTLIQNHHPIIKLVIAAALIWFLAGKVETAWSNHETKVFDSKDAALTAQIAANVSAAQAAQSQATIDATLLAQYKAAVAESQAEIITLVNATKKQQQVDTTLSPDALASHWNDLIKSAEGVHPITSGYQVSQPAAVATVQALDSVPELNAELANDGNVLDKTNALLAGDDAEISDMNAQITGLQKQNDDEITTCRAQVAKTKADDSVALHKSRKKWFIAGMITGFVGGLFGGHSGL